MPQDSSESLCLHTTSQELYLKIPRPAYSFAWNWFQLGDSDPFGCDCTGINFNYGIQADAQTDIIGKYSHFDGTGTGSAQATADFPWFYDHGGTPGTVNADPGNLYPVAGDSTSGCCGYDLGAGAYDDADCASGGYTSTTQCSTYRWTKDGSGNPRLCTRHQQEIIDTGSSPKIDSSSSDITACEYGNQYTWLQGIADDPAARKYPHWAYNYGTGNVDVQGSASSPTHFLAETLLCICHQEIWWENYYNSLYEEDPGNPSTCRIPREFQYGCGGIPLFTWEIMDLHYDDLAAEMSVDPDQIIANVAQGLPLTSEMTAALESVGLLVLGDWSQPNGEPIKKVLKYKTGRAWSEVTQYFFARPGGWSLTCSGATGLSPELARWPQVIRNSSTHTPDCEDILDWMGYACMSAAPFPNDTETCYPASGTCGAFDACDGASLPAHCAQIPSLEGRFNISQWSADCNGILFRYSVYCSDDPDEGTDPWVCCLTNDAFMCVVSAGSTMCKLPEEDMREALTHWIPEEVSQSYRNSWGTSLADLCCGGQGIFDYSGNDCPAPTPQADECD